LKGGEEERIWQPLPSFTERERERDNGNLVRRGSSAEEEGIWEVASLESLYKQENAVEKRKNCGHGDFHLQPHNLSALKLRSSERYFNFTKSSLMPCHYLRMLVSCYLDI
jgi:hypothetical protein